MTEAIPAALGRWLLRGEWRAHPLRNLVALFAIAIGVALGFAIYLINAAAFNEFSAAVRSLSGQSDLQVRATQPWFDEAVYPRVLAHPGVERASPVLEADLIPAGQQQSLKILGIDVFQAAALTPDLIGVPEDERAFDTLADDAIFLSPAAMEWLKLGRGDTLELQVGTRRVALRVAGGLAAARPGQRLAVMDIGAAQWRLERLGVLSHIDLRLQPGIDRDAFTAGLQRALGPSFHVTHSGEQQTRAATMSRAYRVNLNMLALVGLFTGAFLVFSSQALAVIRRRSQLALLRVLGLTRGQLLRQILREAAVLGAAGAVLGLLLGYGAAALALRFFGGDLGGGYFPGVQPQARFSVPAALTFFLLGTGAALLGAASPAWEAARARPAAALKGSGSDAALGRLAGPWPGLALLGAGALLTQAPPLYGLPVAGYLAIALLLTGAIMLMPRVAAMVFGLMSRRAQRRPVPTLALAHLANAPNQAAIALGGVLTSFSLMVAMAIMVASFRVSVDNWLTQVLAADLYVRTSGTLNLEEQAAIAGAAPVARADFQRHLNLTLDPSRPPVTLLARVIDAADPGRSVPLIGPFLRAGDLPADEIPVWVSEAMVDLYGAETGQRLRLPLAGGGNGAEFVVAGVWRDYVRQSGAIQIRLADYRRLTNDTSANDGALWLRPNASTRQAIDALRALPFGAALAFSEPGEIRALSLRIFDRSFAVTYLLEAVAILIGLFGVAATFSAQTLARAREFGMLRHIGLSRRQILGMLGIEGGLLAALGVAAGLLLGMAISLILVFVVNPQSFHWTMEWHPPWGVMVVVGTVLLASAALTALLAGRQAVAGDVVRAVREDW